MVDFKSLIQGELIEIIEWTDESRDSLAIRWPDDDKEIKNGAQLIVRESQQVQFVAAGRFADTFGPGRHTLATENIPVLSTILGWKYGFAAPFKCDVYYVNTRVFAGNKWGTANPVMVRDRDFGVVRLRAFGTYDFRIVDVPVFLRELAGTDDDFRLDEFAHVMRSRIVSLFSDAVATAQVPALDIASRYSELGEALLPAINPTLATRYGLEMTAFVVENVSVPAELEQAIDKRSSMSVIGNLNDYVKYQMGQGVAAGGEAGTAATLPAQMAMGFGMAQEMMRGLGGVGGILGGGPGGGQGGGQAAVPGPAQVPAASGSDDTLQVYTPEQAARLLSVSPEDVMACIDSGELKARRIGTAVRISREALEAFIHG